MKKFLFSMALLTFYFMMTGFTFDRHVLGLYHSAEGFSDLNNPLRKNAEFILNHLGLQLDYWDLKKGLPDLNALNKYRGIIVWLNTSEMEHANAYWTWLKQVGKINKKIILLGRIGPLSDSRSDHIVSINLIHEALLPLGVKTGLSNTSIPFDIEVMSYDPAWIGFELKPENILLEFNELHSFGLKNKVGLTLRQRSTQMKSDAVVLSPQGGIALSPYFIYPLSQFSQSKWITNPFFFFEKALDIEFSPRPDYTTRTGSRIFISHVDGDGLRNLVPGKSDVYAPEMLYDMIYKPYRHIPFSLSVITAEVDPKFLGSARMMQIARKLFALPNVEAASHTFAHPLVWDKKLLSKDEAILYRDAIDMQKSKNALPWAISDYKYDPVREIVESTRYIETQLLPIGKTCRLLFWSGNCIPDATALRTAEENGILNINGGDSRFDEKFSSHVNLAPLTRQTEGYTQIHAGSSNENLYTNLWTQTFGGYQAVIHTFQKTEFPRRLLPIDVYYHHYSGEHLAAINAIKIVYDWVLSQSPFPMFTSMYIETVKGFLSTQIKQKSRYIWVIQNNGQCRTVRFDHTTQYPDLVRSTGIVGFQHHQGSLYVFLDESNQHVIALTRQKQTLPYVEKATGDVDHVQRKLNGFSFDSWAFYHAMFSFRNMVPSATYRIMIQKEQEQESLTAQADAQGTLRFESILGGKAHIQVEGKMISSTLSPQKNSVNIINTLWKITQFFNSYPAFADIVSEKTKE